MRSRVSFLALALALVAGLLIARELPAHAQAGPESIKLKWLGFNVAAPGATTNIITKDALGNTIAGLTARDVGAFRITIQVATTTVVDLTATDGTTTKVIHLNGGSSLTAGCLYTFSWGTASAAPFVDQTTPKALLWNVQVETNSAIDVLQVDEVNNGVL